MLAVNDDKYINKYNTIQYTTKNKHKFDPI